MVEHQETKILIIVAPTPSVNFEAEASETVALIDETTKQIEALEQKKDTANGISTKIDEVLSGARAIQNVIDRIIARQQTYSHTCAEFSTLCTDALSALKSGDPSVVTLAQEVLDALVEPCSNEEIEAIQSVKEEAVKVVEEVVMEIEEKQEILQVLEVTLQEIYASTTTTSTTSTTAVETTAATTTETTTTAIETTAATEVTTEVTELCDSSNSGICLCNFISNFIQVTSCESMSLTFVYENTLTLVEDINIVELTQILTQQLNTALQIDLGNIELSAVSQFVIQSTSLITSTDVTLGAITTGIIQQLGDLQWESITLAQVEQLVIQQAAGLQQLNAARNIELEDITLGGVSQGIIKVLEDISLFGAYTWISEQLQNILPIQVQAEDIEDIVQWLISELGSLSVGREEVTLNDVFNEVSERLDSSSITTLGELNSVYNSLNYGDFTLGEVYLWIVQLLADVAQEETATETAVDTEVPAVLQTLEQITLDNVSQFIFQQLDSITVTGVQDWIIQVLGSASVPAGKHSPIFVLLFQYDLHLSVSAPADSGYEGSWPLQTSPVSMFPKFTTVFGVPVFAASSVSV